MLVRGDRCEVLELFLFSCDGGPRVLHVLTHSFPTRRSSDLPQVEGAGPARPHLAREFLMRRYFTRIVVAGLDPAIRLATRRPCKSRDGCPRDRKSTRLNSSP